MLADDDNENEKPEIDYSKYKTDIQVNECVLEFEMFFTDLKCNNFYGNNKVLGIHFS